MAITVRRAGDRRPAARGALRAGDRAPALAQGSPTTE
jgi:hypothetical protein